MKYKFDIGQQVRIIDSLKVGDSFHVWCNEDMAQWAGYSARIVSKEITHGDNIWPCYHVYVDHPCFVGFNKEWVYTEDMLEFEITNDNEELVDIDLECLIGGNT